MLTALVGDPDVVTGPLRGHGRRAASRRWTRALGVPALLGAALAGTAALWGISVVPVWVWPTWIAVTAWCALLAADRAGALGHRVDDSWLVMRAGSVDRRRDCIATAGIIGWTVRQSPFQRRAGVATLVAATAAGIKRYPLIDVPRGAGVGDRGAGVTVGCRQHLGGPLGSHAAAVRPRTASIRSRSCSVVAAATGGPPHSRRSSL